MATFRLRHFSTHHVLRSIAANRLLAFLEPYREFFIGRGYALPATGAGSEIEYQRLIDIFMTPNESSPPELLDALFLVDEMSTPEGMSNLIYAASQVGLHLDNGDEQSPADIAIQVWLENREILERKHAEQFMFKAKSFEYYQATSNEPPAFSPLSAAAQKLLEKDLDDWFFDKRRGRGTRVFTYPSENEVQFLVRHGEPYKREESLTGTAISSVCYRPLKYDIVVYDRRLGELRINARLIGEKKKYRQLFGKHLFGDETCFPGIGKYTLEPLRHSGAACLACVDVDGIESIALTEIHFAWDGAHHPIEIWKAGDVFSAFEACGKAFPESSRIVKATFRVKFTDSKTPRSVRLRPSNIAEYTRDSDAGPIEKWLRLRGFSLNQEVEENVEPALAGS